jgi:2-keto-4-pentenoate hydratase/2-oxohepta-3-ene-1,7-dioic acid hydratase in catechol pathway
VCTILVAWRAGAAETLVLAANRDEFRGRPADEPAAIAPGVFAGRDRRAGGTWLAVGPSGLAAITNIAGAEPRDGAPSRGMLPLLALRGELPASFAPWSPFNLLVADAAGLRVIVHRGAPVPAETHRLAPGVHAIVNEPYGSAVSARARRAAVGGRPRRARRRRPLPPRRRVRHRIGDARGAGRRAARASLRACERAAVHGTRARLDSRGTPSDEPGMSVRLANLAGRAALLDGGGHAADVERASGGRFPSDPMAALQAWDAFASWGASLPAGAFEQAVDEERLGPPVPRPQKVVGIGVNYKEHAREAGMELPKQPMVFTKFASCLTGPRAAVRLSSETVDWEVELVVVVGRHARHVPAERALDCVAGYCVGQDVSDRRLQFADKPPQFSLGKSLDTFGPIGPAVVTLDALRDPNDLAIRCEIDGTTMQDGRTSDMIFSVPELLAFLSARIPLDPGDLVFTGTPAGVGSTRTPRRYLKPGETIVSTIEGLGTMSNRCVEA